MLWAEAVNTAVYILNRTSSSKNPIQTPFEVWHGTKPDLSHIRVFGSVAYVHVPQQMRKKLDARAKRLLLVGYENDSTNYRLFDPKKRTVTVSRHVIFCEQIHEEDPSTNSDDELVRLPKIADPEKEVFDQDNDPEQGLNMNEEVDNCGEKMPTISSKPSDNRHSTLRPC